MFSTSNFALVTHSDGMFTRQSASTNGTNDDLQSDLIAFLSVVQKYNVDYLPITWQAALSNLGEGGSGTVSQSTFNADMPLAFKRFHDPDGDVSDKYFLPLISEVLILSQPAIRNHPHIVNLEGICWEIKPRTEKAVPVLVFEKAVWDLQQYMKLREGINMSIVDRLKICAEIGSAIKALHAYGMSFHIRFILSKSNMDTDVIHGDIKPQNVLVFKNATGKTTIKMADFGYSTLAAGGTGEVFLPKSTPWNAPEHHWEGFKVPDAKKTDVYSFGLLCLWVLFGTSLRDIPQTTAEGATELLSSNTPLGPSSFLERLNGEGEGEMQRVAEELVHTVPGLDAEHKVCLKEFFNLTVVHNPDHRTSDINKLLDLLLQEP